jgi:hypothetical protein
VGTVDRRCGIQLADAPVRYDVRVWALPADSWDTPLIAVDGVPTPELQIDDRIAPGARVGWTARAVVTHAGRRFLTRWSHAQAAGAGCDVVQVPWWTLFTIKVPDT